jgi:hypothetical protein
MRAACPRVARFGDHRPRLLLTDLAVHTMSSNGRVQALGRVNVRWVTPLGEEVASI